MPDKNSAQCTVHSQKKTNNSSLFISHFKLKLGFTLIELLVVISIIGILIAAGTVSWTNAQVKGRDSKRKSDLKTIQQALELYFQANGRYPPYNIGICTGAYIECVGWCGFINSSSYPEVKNSLVPAYISKMPTDPAYPGNDQFYNYFYEKISQNSYKIIAGLENPKDTDKGGPYAGEGWCSGANFYPQYNYMVQNP